MSAKPVEPLLHGIIDYAFSGILLGLPAALGLKKKAIKRYRILGAAFLAGNALTDTPVGLYPALSMKGHQLSDAGFLATLAGMSFWKPVRTHKKALAFHVAFLAAAVMNYILTDYDA